jgi:hypothetical protein
VFGNGALVVGFERFDAQLFLCKLPGRVFGKRRGIMGFGLVELGKGTGCVEFSIF